VPNHAPSIARSSVLDWFHFLLGGPLSSVLSQCAPPSCVCAFPNLLNRPCYTSGLWSAELHEILTSHSANPYLSHATRYSAAQLIHRPSLSPAKMGRPGLRSRPSHYPALPFHVIRVCYLISTLVVAIILSYFVYHLKRDNFKIPWTFLVVS
jgi:hypothetical protein